MMINDDNDNNDDNNKLNNNKKFAPILAKNSNFQTLPLLPL